jgi:peptide/nickel transport system permease protein
VRSLWDNQYFAALKRILTLRFDQKSWSVESQGVGDIIASSVVPSLSVTLPVLILTTLISTSLGLLASFNRGKPLDRGVMFLAVLGMSISYLVYVIVGQYFGAQWPRLAFDLEIFSTFGYEPVLPLWDRVQGSLQDNGVQDPGFFRTLLAWFAAVPASIRHWPYYCLLPVIIGVIVAMGYDTRFYRAVMVEECNKDYIRTARAKGASNRRVMYRHMLRNALIPIITRVMISLPFIIMGSLLVEIYFGIPGMGQQLFNAITNKDFPVVEAITALLAAIFIITNILTDVLYAVVDPRVTLK